MSFTIEERDAVSAPHRGCEQLEVPGLPDDSIHSFVHGLDAEPRQLTASEASDLLNDPFAVLVLQAGMFPRTAGEVLVALSNLASGNSLGVHRFFLVGEGSQIPHDELVPVARNLRFLVTCGRGPMGPDIMMSSFDPDHGVVELMAWDERTGGFNFYRTMPNTSAWVFAGNSRHALSAPTRDSGPFESHRNGHILMKELRVPWVHWHSPFATVSPSVLTAQGLDQHPWVQRLEPGGAYTLEDDAVKPAIERWTAKRVELMLAREAVETPRRMLEQLLSTLTVNLMTSHVSSAAAKSGSVDSIDLPDTFFVDSASLAAIGGLDLPPVMQVSSTIYASALATFEFRLEDRQGFRRAGDTHFAFLIPERAHEDVVTVRQAREAGIVSRRLLACLVMVDFPNPVFSTIRPALLKYIPDSPFDGDGEAFSNGIAAAILAAPESSNPQTPEGRFAECWATGEQFEPPFNERLNAYYTAIAQQLTTQTGFDAYVRLAESRRAQVLPMPISESPLLFAQTNIPAGQRTMTTSATVEES